MTTQTRKNKAEKIAAKCFVSKLGVPAFCRPHLLKNEFLVTLK